MAVPAGKEGCVGLSKGPSTVDLLRVTWEHHFTTVQWKPERVVLKQGMVAYYDAKFNVL